MSLVATSNQTAGHSGWYRSESANPGDVVAFDMYLENACKAVTARHVTVATVLPGETMNVLPVYGYVSSENAGATHDTTTVKVVDGSLQGFEYIPGHVWIRSPACPSGCSGADSINGESGVEIGDLGPGQNADVQWEAWVTNYRKSE